MNNRWIDWVCKYNIWNNITEEEIALFHYGKHRGNYIYCLSRYIVFIASGGSFGLWTGISCFTITEFIYFCGKRIKFLIFGKRSWKDKEEESCSKEKESNEVSLSNHVVEAQTHAHISMDCRKHDGPKPSDEALSEAFSSEENCNNQNGRITRVIEGIENKAFGG